jgi:hypothetical protein
MLVEASMGFVADRLCFGSFSLCPAMGQPVARGNLLGLAAFLPLSSATKTNKFPHQKLDGIQVVWIEAIQASEVSTYTPSQGDWITPTGRLEG